GLLLPTNSATSIVATDDVLDVFSPVIVPATGKYLLELHFNTGPTVPSGTFQVLATPGLPTNTYWAGGEAFPNFSNFEFSNIPSAGPPVVLGSITIVPEPATAVLALGSLVALRLITRRRRRDGNTYPIGIVA